MVWATASSSHDSRRTELVQLLQQEVEYTRNLMQSLEIENETLSEHRTSALEEIIQDKLLDIFTQGIKCLLTVIYLINIITLYFKHINRDFLIDHIILDQ